MTRDALTLDTIERGGRQFRVEVVRDEDMGPPWQEHDGHGVVSEWTRRAKRPGELVLCEDHGSRRFYDVQESTTIAKRDGWDAPPYGGTPGQKAARAVRRDFEHLRGWCNDEWQWVGVVVTELCTCPKGHEHDGETRSLWGIESGDETYLRQVADELADEMLYEGA